MNHLIAQAGPSIIGQIFNLLILLLILAIPFILWDRIRKWNSERNEKLDQIGSELKAIRELLTEGKAEPDDTDNPGNPPENPKNQLDD